MTAHYLQKALVQELKGLLQDFYLQSPNLDANNKTIYKPPEIYEQCLPIQTDLESDDPYPYVIVRLVDGMAETDKQEVVTLMVIGIIDEDINTNGHRDVLNVTQKIYERFFKNPILANKYRFKGDFTWTLQDEDMYPYYFGAIKMTWILKSMEMEDAYS